MFRGNAVRVKKTQYFDGLLNIVDFRETKIYAIVKTWRKLSNGCYSL